MEVQTEQLAVTVCVRLQPQNTEDESRGMTQTFTVKSYKRSLRSGLALSETTNRAKLQYRGTIRNVFEVRMENEYRLNSQAVLLS